VKEYHDQHFEYELSKEGGRPILTGRPFGYSEDKGGQKPGH
jgi:hypothetical protein